MSATVDVTCPAGTITGETFDHLRRFHSIPYSHISAPFNDAQPAPAGLRIDATAPRPDTIALSLTTPDGASRGSDLPVMVFIHGGRFEEGSHADLRTGADAFARQGIIQVRVGYRLTLPGLMRFPDDAPSHFRAAHDCQLALEWVQRNIESFGGDPTNVTLVGQSAGAALVLWLCRRDHYRGGFRRALAMSPAFPRMAFERRKPVLRAALGKPLTRAALGNAAPSRVERAYRRLRRFYFTDMALGPAPLAPEELADVELVVTTTREEFHDSGARADAAGWGKLAVRASGRRMGLRYSRMRRYLTEAGVADPDHVYGRFIGDSLIRRWAADVAENAPGRVWQAEFVSPEPGGAARHCDDLNPLFGAPPYAPGEGLNAWLVRWCRGAAPCWPTYREGRQVLRVDLAGGSRHVVTDPLGYVRRAFDRS